MDRRHNREDGGTAKTPGATFGGAADGDARRASAGSAPVRRAAADSIPVLMGYLTMGFAAGVLLSAHGGVPHPWFWGALTSAVCISGALQFIFVGWFAAPTPLATVALLTLFLNMRYSMYGLSLIERFRRTSWLRRLYLIWALTDETYALEVAHPAEDPCEDLRYCFTLSILNHLYWIIGVTAGALAGAALPFSPRGIDFAMLALFLVILTDQCRERANRIPALIGGAAALIAFAVAGPRWMLIVAMALILGVLLLLRRRLECSDEKEPGA